jgi:uncharacterized protein YqjF (DUF2071 family)
MRPRFLTAHWRYLVMLNYEFDPDVLQPLVPLGTELDAWGGRCYVSLVGFLFLKTKLLGLGIPWHRDFEEINLRFYVRRKGPEGWRRGVVFIKEIVPRWAIAAVARWVYNENYVALPMSHALTPPAGQTPGHVEYRWRCEGRTNVIAATFAGTPTLPLPGSEPEFITEHYWGYCRQRDGSTVEYRVEHPPWPVWPATEAKLDCDVAHFYGSQYAEALGRTPTSAFVAEGSPVTVRQGERLASPAVFS